MDTLIRLFSITWTWRAIAGNNDGQFKDNFVECGEGWRMENVDNSMVDANNEMACNQYCAGVCRRIGGEGIYRLYEKRGGYYRRFHCYKSETRQTASPFVYHDGSFRCGYGGVRGFEECQPREEEVVTLPRNGRYTAEQFCADYDVFFTPDGRVELCLPKWEDVYTRSTPLKGVQLDGVCGEAFVQRNSVLRPCQCGRFIPLERASKTRARSSSRGFHRKTSPPKQLPQSRSAAYQSATFHLGESSRSSWPLLRPDEGPNSPPPNACEEADRKGTSEKTTSWQLETRRGNQPRSVRKTNSSLNSEKPDSGFSDYKKNYLSEAWLADREARSKVTIGESSRNDSVKTNELRDFSHRDLQVEKENEALLKDLRKVSEKMLRKMAGKIRETPDEATKTFRTKTANAAWGVSAMTDYILSKNVTDRAPCRPLSAQELYELGLAKNPSRKSLKQLFDDETRADIATKSSLEVFHPLPLKENFESRRTTCSGKRKGGNAIRLNSLFDATDVRQFCFCVLIGWIFVYVLSRKCTKG